MDTAVCGSFFPISELLPPVCFKVRNSTSTRKMREYRARLRDRGIQTYQAYSICKKYVTFLATVGFCSVVVDVRADVLKACVVYCVVSLPYRSRLIFP